MPDSDLRPNLDFVISATKLHHGLAKVMLSPAHAMWRTPVICWKDGCSCCEKLPVQSQPVRDFELTLAAADMLRFFNWKEKKMV